MTIHPALTAPAAAVTATGLTPTGIVGFFDREPSITYCTPDAVIVTSECESYDSWSMRYFVHPTLGRVEEPALADHYGIDVDALNEACADLECAIDEMLRTHVRTLITT